MTDEPVSHSGLQERAIKGVAWTMIHTVVSIPIAFLVNLLLARVLEPAGYGRLAFLTTVIAVIGGVLALGLTAAMIQFGAKAHAAGRVDEVRAILSSSQGFRLIFVAPVLTIFVIALVDVPVALLVVAIAFGVWVPAFLDGAPITLFIENKTAAGAKIAMVSNLIIQVGVVGAVLWLGTADGVWAARIVLTATAIALALPVISRGYRRAVLRPRLPRHFPDGFWRFAIPTGTAALIASLALSRTEVLYLTWWSTPEAAGLFALAFGLAGHVFAPAQALTGPLIPAVSGLHEVGQDKVRAAFGRTMRASSTVVALMSAGTLPALTVLVPTLYGEQYQAAAPAVLALGVVGGLTVSTGALSAFVLARLSGGAMLRTNICALAVDVTVALALIPWLGLWGAVLANNAATITRVAILFVLETRSQEIAWWRGVALLSPLGWSAVACALAWAATTVVDINPWVEATLTSLVALLVLTTALRVTSSGLEPGDRDAVLRTVPSKFVPVASFGLGLVTRRASGQ